MVILVLNFCSNLVPYIFQIFQANNPNPESTILQSSET